MDYDQTIWFNQNFFSFKDLVYGTNTTFDIYIACSTNDYKNFSYLTLGLNISSKDKKRYSCNLKINEVCDLIISIEDIIKDLELIYSRRDSEIYKVYSNNKSLKIRFQVSKSNERIVIIAINYGENDFSITVLPFSVFQVLFKLLKSYEDNYTQLIFSLVNRSLLTSIKEEISGLAKNVKEIPSSLIEVKNLETTEKEIEDLNVEESTNNNLQSNFDSFINDNLEKIEVPDLNEISNNSKKLEVNFSSSLLDEFCKGSYDNFESFLISCSTNPIPLESFYGSIKGFLEDNEPLPNISITDIKLLYYISTLFFRTKHKDFIYNSVEISSVGIPVLKYNGQEFITKDIISLVSDLLMLVFYTKLLTDRIKQKNQDSYSNKSLLYLLCRTLCDCFVFSFLSKNNFDSILNISIERYKYYYNKGFFSNSEELLKLYSCSIITPNELSSYLKNVVSKVIECQDIKTFYEQHFKSKKFELTIDKMTNLEQISKFVNIESDSKIGRSTTESSKPYSNNISPIIQFIVEFEDEIPSNIRNKFLEFSKILETSNFKNTLDFKLEEFGDNILKALSIWDYKVDKEYNMFINKVKNLESSRDLILANLNGELEMDGNKSSDWLSGISLSLD